MRTVAIVQARMGSSRLPGKILLDLAGKPMIQRCLERLGKASCLDQVVVATTILSEDDAVANICESLGYGCHRGSENDLLDRYYHAAKAEKAELVVRITSDNPLVDPSIVDMVVDCLKQEPALDYCANRLDSHTWPIGLDAEAFTMEALAKAWREDKDPAWREHVTPYMYFNPARFNIRILEHGENLGHLRWTVDTSEDFELIQRIYTLMDQDHFSWQEVLDLVRRHPELSLINAHVGQREAKRPENDGLVDRHSGPID